MNRFVTTAPVLVVVLVQTPPLVPRLAGYWKDKPYYLLDIGMAAEHFCLQAAELGLGTCILGWFDEDGVRRLLNLPRTQRIPLVITLGYPSDPTIRPKQRKPASEVWRWNVR
jgi:nitroreductase